MGTGQGARGGSVPGRLQRHADRAWFGCDWSGRGTIGPRRFVTRVAVAGLLISGAGMIRAQEPAANPADQPGEAQPLSLRYHFSERYSTQEDPQKPEVMTQYRVASRDTVSQVTEKPQGAPVREEKSVQSIYTERVAKAEKGMAIAVVRRYDLVNFKTTVPIRPFKTKRLEGMTIFYQLQKSSTPLVLSMTEGRGLRDDEFIRICQQNYLPILSTVLPPRPVLVGDNWVVPRLAAWALIGDMPQEEDYDLSAELIEVRKSPTGSSLTAVMGVKGRVVISNGPNGVNAQVEFTFEPPAAPPPAAVPLTEEAAKDQPVGKETARTRRAPGLIEARGHISKVRLAHEFTEPLPGNDGRFKRRTTRRLLVERRTSDQPGGAPEGGALSVPATPPAPTVENSWLSYEDEQGRFHFRHPQEFRAKVYPEGGVELIYARPDGRDVIEMNLVPKTGDPQRDRLAGDPVQQKKFEEDQWKREGQVVLPGPAGWLPDKEWSPLNRKVYRFEAALRPGDDGGPGPQVGRVYLDHYLVQFRRNEILRVIAITTRDPHLNFRSQAEQVIKSFDFGPLDDSLPVSSPSQGSSAEPPR
jgi:hypothetical protein